MEGCEMAEFKDILFELRKSRKYTQTELARILDVSTSTIAMWETGKRTPTRLKYEAISDLFNVDLDYLYGKTNLKRRIMYDEFGNCYTPASTTTSPSPAADQPDHTVVGAAKPALSDRAYMVGRAYEDADYLTQRMVERTLGIEEEAELKEPAGRQAFTA